jgi:hypothetical protein
VAFDESAVLALVNIWRHLLNTTILLHKLKQAVKRKKNGQTVKKKEGALLLFGANFLFSS